MIKNVLQCCYTNASREAGDIVSSGWQAVCVSPDLPSDAFSTCTKIQNSNSSIQNTMTDENGNVLNLFEVCGDGSFIYVIRTQYGLLDRLGRANMFSHAYIFPCKDSTMISDPNSFLTLSNENFKDNEEAANEFVEELSRLPTYDINQAMQRCGLDKVKLLTLVKSVYAQMSDKKTAKPLYIQYDGSEETLRALLFCIYYAMPLAMRKRLSVASVKTGNTTEKNVIFSKKAIEQELYFNPKSGDSTILTTRTHRRISRLGFLDFAVANITHPDIQRYFEILENKTIELGDSTGANELIMKIAHLLLSNNNLCDVEDSELDVRLSDALRSNSVGSIAMNDYIAMLLSEITSRRQVLTEENESALTERLEASATPSLLNAAEQYNFYRFNELPVNEAANKLSRMSRTVFQNYRSKLTTLDNGRKILDYFYAEILLKQYGTTWDGIQKVLEASKDLTYKPLTDDKIDECAWGLYCNSLDGIREGHISHIVSEYKNYMRIMQQRLGLHKSLECDNAAKEAFWDKLSYDDIDFNMFHSYRDLEINSTKCQCLLAYCNLPSVLITSGDIAFFKAANTFFADSYAALRSQYKGAIEKIIGEAKLLSTVQNKYFEQWCRVMFSTSDSLVLEELINLYKWSEASDLSQILNAFNRFVISCSKAQISPSLSKEVAKIVASICVKLDSERRPVPLDGWLLLGGYLYTNSFSIFDNIEPFILEEDEIDVISNSSLIRKRKYWDDADVYVRDRGREYRTVKKWLSELQHQKRTASDTRKGGHESSQGIIGRGMSALSKLTQDDQRHKIAPDQLSKQKDTGRERFDAPDSLGRNDDEEQQSSKKGFFSGLFGKK